MSLGNALQVAQNSLAAVSRRTEIVSRNVAGANDTNYVRREAVIVPGSLRSATNVSRAALDGGLVRSGLEARSDASARKVVADGIAALSFALNGPDGERSPSAALSRLHDALQTWSTQPSDDLLAQATLEAAGGVERAFKDADRAITRSQAEIDGRIAGQVDRLNERLTAFGEANGEIVNTARRGLAPPLDALDRRDAALRDIAEIVPVTTLQRPGGDLMLTTRRGATLFETSPRQIAVGASGGLTVDGVPLAPGAGPDEPKGRLEALLHLRDDVAARSRAQIDAAANAAVEAFAPSGLFASSAAPATAASLGVPASYDMANLRAGPPSLSDNIIAAAESLGETRTFPPDIGLSQTGSLLSFAADAISSLDESSRLASGASARAGRIAQVLEEKRIQAGGVDVDAEMTRLLALERSYEASARLVAVADRMLAELLAAVR